MGGMFTMAESGVAPKAMPVKGAANSAALPVSASKMRNLLRVFVIAMFVKMPLGFHLLSIVANAICAIFSTGDDPTRQYKIDRAGQEQDNQHKVAARAVEIQKCSNQLA
jgi:hypothetical protein